MMNHESNEARPDTGEPQGSEAGTPAETAASEALQEGAGTVDTDALARAEAERDDLRDRLLRLAADMENLRRRSEREVADARSYAIAKFAGDMLTVADNMGRALQSIPAEQREGAEGTLKALIDGAELTERDMLRSLERHGVKKIDPKGERFDPHFHQAVFEMADASVPSGTVAQVMQVGYSIGDRVLRPAMVGVARGGAKPQVAPQAAAGEAVDRSA